MTTKSALLDFFVKNKVNDNKLKRVENPSEVGFEAKISEQLVANVLK